MRAWHVIGDPAVGSEQRVLGPHRECGRSNLVARIRAQLPEVTLAAGPPRSGSPCVARCSLSRTRGS